LLFDNGYSSRWSCNGGSFQSQELQVRFLAMDVFAHQLDSVFKLTFDYVRILFDSRDTFCAGTTGWRKRRESVDFVLGDTEAFHDVAETCERHVDLLV
jgi:hypothetical protein